MTHTLKMLGVAVSALLALGTVGASGAAAASFHSGNEKAILTGDNVGEGNWVVTLADGSQVVCPEVTFRGTAMGLTSTELTVHPTFATCPASFLSATMDTTGCNFIFSSTTNATGHLPISIECTSGYAIKWTISAIGCTLTFAPNTTGGTKVTNLGASQDETLHSTFKVKSTPSGFCPESIGTDLEITGTATLRGFEDKKVEGPIDETEGAAPGKDVEAKYTEGAQVGIWWE